MKKTPKITMNGLAKKLDNLVGGLTLKIDHVDQKVDGLTKAVDNLAIVMFNGFEKQGIQISSLGEDAVNLKEVIEKRYYKIKTPL